jgi:signal transduction histidine kinase/ligand-binding sensor domain-containing protein/CheY-like chemotaxis protein
MYFEHLTMRDGLSQSTVMSVLQDSQGYLWLASESGLDRYDGYSIRKYRRERGNAQGLANDYIWKIAEDARGDLWLATMGGGVARWDRATDRFQQFRHDPNDPHSLSGDAVRTLLIDDRGLVWAGTLRSGLNVLDPKTGRARRFLPHAGDARALPSDAVFALYQDRAHHIWVGTDGGLSRYERATDDFIHFGTKAGAALSDMRVRAIYEDHTGALWIGTLEGGLNRLDPRTGQISSFRHNPNDAGSLSNNRVLAVFEDDAQRLWVGTAKGLNLFDRRSGRFVRYVHDPEAPFSLPDDDIMSLYQDRGGVLWVGTRAGGASHWQPSTWALGHYRSPLIRNTAVNAFADDGKGVVWVGTSDGLVEIDTLTRQERRYERSSKAPMRLPDDRVMTLLYDRSGGLWIGTMDGGLARYDGAQKAMRSYQHVADDAGTIPSNGIMSLYEDLHGSIWVGTFGGGLARIERASGLVTRYPYDRADATGLSNSRASAIAEDARGNLWIGTIGGGLNLLDRKTGRFYHYRRNDRDPSSLSDDTIYALHVDSSGQLWIGTAGGGLDKLIGTSSDPQSVRFQNDLGLQNMPSQVVYGIESDAGGRLWLSTNNGLVRLDPRKGTSLLFRDAHGLQAEEFNFNAHYRGRDGTLYFGGNNGFNAFQPEAVTPKAPPPQLALTSVTILNRVLAPRDLPAPGRPLAVSYNDKLVTFGFSALDFTSPANNRYLYRLEGFDADWRDAGRVPRATYTNLDSGEYVFKVRAANANGVWSKDDLTIPVHVGAAPWDTATARTLYVLASLVLLGYLWQWQRMRSQRQLLHRRELEHMVRIRTHELEASNQQLQVLSRAKSDFLARMNHELRTPMNGVLGMSELLLDTRLDAAQRRFVEGINRSAESLLAIVNDVLDFSKIEAGRLQLNPVDCDLVEVVEHIAEMLAVRAAAKGIEMLCDAPVHPMHRVRADAVRLRQVLVNLGGNAVKFTDKGEVTIRLVSLGGEGDSLRVRLEVIDTGIGIEPENQSRIFEEFSQADASTTRRFGGTGLGLAISRQLVELMGGQLTLTSAPGVGSTFAFELLLPLADLPAQMFAPSDLKGRRILVAEENAAVRRFIARAVGEWGAQSVCVSTLSEALQELRTAPCETLVISDSLLDKHGTMLLKSLLTEASLRLRIVRLTSFVSLASAQIDGESRFDAAVTKPIRLAQLHRALNGGGGNLEERRGLPTPDPHAHTSRLRGRVLVVEDQELNREVAEAMLRSIGLDVDAVADGQQALDRLSCTSYDVVLMDVQMPMMDGYSATAELRRRERAGERVPVIALTADTTPAAQEACVAAGMDDYLGKPLRTATLYTVLARWLPPQAQDERQRDAF